VKAGFVSRGTPEDDVDHVNYKITALGIHWLNSVIGKKFR